MKSSLEFYSQLRPFEDFSGLTQDAHYVPVPEDWWVVLTDVKGSTSAIQQGRYKQVNLIGASSITCVLNTLGRYEFPFVFGGDGATMLIPGEHYLAVKDELQSLQTFSLNQFGLELRVGFVAIRSLYDQGHKLEVSKYQLSPGNCLAQFRGTGLTRAESMIKGKESGALTLRPERRVTRPHLEGLSCRLNPLASKNGTILSILAHPQTDEPGQTKRILHDLLKSMGQILGDFNSVNPVDFRKLKWPLIPSSLVDEATLNGRGQGWLTRLFSKFLSILIESLSLSTNLPLGPFRPRKYKQELVLNSDFKKFDETLRMVIDCDLLQAEQIDQLLKEMHARGLIYYGTHRSSEALMTCMVKSATQNQHIHFIDGSNGGYTLAAVQMKQQMKQDLKAAKVA